jgi:hypothetical protein
MQIDSTSSALRQGVSRRFVHVVALIALILFGSLAQTIHESTVHHAVCPEHGELLHVERAPAEGGARATNGSLLVEQPSRSDEHAGPSSAGPEHDVCWFATLLRPGSSPWIGTSIRFVHPACSFCFRPVRASVRVAAVAPLSFAPKHSPPARAA